MFGDLGVSSSTGSGEPQADLAAMLAEMDNRLQALQQELESVAVPIARRGPEARRAPRRPDVDPLAALSAEQQAPAGYEHPSQAVHPAPPAASAPPPAPAPAPERPVRPPRGALGPPRTPPRAPHRQQQQQPPPSPSPPATRTAAFAPSAAPATAAERPRLDDPDTAPRARAGRRIGTVVRSRPAAIPEEAPRRAQPPARSGASEAVVRQTILEAEEEARRVVESAHDRIAEIGARTRALLEQSLAAPQAPTLAPGPRRRRAFVPEPPEQRVYDGAVTVEAGPFADVIQLNEFEDALAAVPGVADVYIRTFERYYAHFEVSVREPTALIAELQARIADALRIVDAGDDDLRLEIVRARDAEAPLG
jgi:hypothetical protein